MTTHC